MKKHVGIFIGILLVGCSSQEQKVEVINTNSSPELEVVREVYYVDEFPDITKDISLDGYIWPNEVPKESSRSKYEKIENLDLSILKALYSLQLKESLILDPPSNITKQEVISKLFSYEGDVEIEFIDLNQDGTEEVFVLNESISGANTNFMYSLFEFKDSQYHHIKTFGIPIVLEEQRNGWPLIKNIYASKFSNYQRIELYAYIEGKYTRIRTEEPYWHDINSDHRLTPDYYEITTIKNEKKTIKKYRKKTLPVITIPKKNLQCRDFGWRSYTDDFLWPQVSEEIFFPEKTETVLKKDLATELLTTIEQRIWSAKEKARKDLQIIKIDLNFDNQEELFIFNHHDSGTTHAYNLYTKKDDIYEFIGNIYGPSVFLEPKNGWLQIGTKRYLGPCPDIRSIITFHDGKYYTSRVENFNRSHNKYGEILMKNYSPTEFLNISWYDWKEEE